MGSEPKDTYKYKVLLEGRIIFKGFTYDLHRRECEHHTRWPKCKVEQVGSKVTWQEAQTWAGRQSPPPRRHPEWKDEWPTEKGLWWFYGWCFGKEGFRDDQEPELCLVEVSGSLDNSSFTYVTNGHFLYKAEGATGKWQEFISPNLPNLEEAPNGR